MGISRRFANTCYLCLQGRSDWDDSVFMNICLGPHEEKSEDWYPVSIWSGDRLGTPGADGLLVYSVALNRTVLITWLYLNRVPAPPPYELQLVEFPGIHSEVCKCIMSRGPAYASICIRTKHRFQETGVNKHVFHENDNS